MQLALNLKNSMHWIQKHKEKSDAQSTTLAIQTLRNTILVAVFIGGYALNSAYGIINSYEDSNKSTRSKVRNIILAVILFASFLCWANVIRLASHLGYMIGTLDYVDKVDLAHLSDKQTGGTNGAAAVGDVSAAVGYVTTPTAEGFTDVEMQSMTDKKQKRVLKYEIDREFLVRKTKSMLRNMLVYFRSVWHIYTLCMTT